MIKKIYKTEGQWRSTLTPEQFRTMREKDTETPFSCAWNQHKNGTYFCVACDLELFRTDAKFESGTGWPSYFSPVDPDHIETQRDVSFGMDRTEVICARCGSHLGHVFSDGPPPTGLRYCINSIALKFKPDKT